MTVNVTYREAGAVVPGATTIKNSPLSNGEIDGNFKSVKDAVEVLSTGAGAGLIGVTPVGGVAATTVQGAIAELDSEKVNTANLAATSGSSLVGYIPAGTGAVATTVEGALRSMDRNIPTKKNTLAAVLKKAQSGVAIEIACYGDSLTYGMDVSADGQATQINGSSVTRSRYPYPEALGTALGYMGINRYVYNRGYPGDTAADGLARWAVSGPTDISFLMYGTNDGNPTRNVTIEQYKINMAQMIEREIDKGAAVVLIGPPLLSDQDSNLSVRAYSSAAKKLSEEYGIGWIDSVEQLSTITNLWTDGVHLTSYAYNELGWHLSALFANRDTGSRNVCAGSIFYPSDYIGKGGLIQPDSYTGFTTKSGNVLRLTAGQALTIGAYFDDDVFPVVHSYNSTASTVTINALYAGNGTYRGIPYADLGHNPATSLRESLTCGILRKGYRTLVLTNAGAATAYIEAVEFVGKGHATTRYGMRSKSDALSGAFMLSRDAAAAIDWWTAIDYSKKLAAPYKFTAHITQNGTSGLAVFKNRGSIGLLSDILFVFRSGNDLLIREIVGGVVTTNTYASVFAAGSFTGEIELDVTQAEINVYVDGVLKATKASPLNTAGYPGLMSDPAAKMLCGGAFVQGHVKGPY